jgi:hypothetical protein
MSDFGNGVVVAIEALQDELNLLNVLWRTAPEAARTGVTPQVSNYRH